MKSPVTVRIGTLAVQGATAADAAALGEALRRELAARLAEAPAPHPAGAARLALPPLAAATVPARGRELGARLAAQWSDR